MDGRVIISLDPDVLRPMIEQAVERTVERQQNPSIASDSFSDQLLYGEKQAATKLGMTATALKEERLKGRIEYLKRGRQIKYLPEHLIAYVRSWRDASDD